MDEIPHDDQYMLSDLIDHKTDAYQLFKWVNGLQRNFHPIFIIDEYDRVRDEQTHIRMADTIKYFSDYSCRATIIIVGVARDVKGLFGGHPSIERNVRQVGMAYMNSDELHQIFSKRLPDLGMTVDNNVETKIIRLAQGLPGYTHLLGQNATRSAISKKSLNVTMDDLQTALSKSIETCDEKIKELYARCVRSTKPQNQFKEVLLACALAPIDERGYFSTSAVREPFSKIMGRELDIPYFARHINQFSTEERGPALVREGKPKSYQFRFTDALLRPYVVIKGMTDGMASIDMLN